MSDEPRQVGHEKEERYRCQFCGKESQAQKWVNDHCPHCKRKYDAILAQDSEE